MTEAHAKGGREEELHTFRTGKGERRATHSGGCIFLFLRQCDGVCLNALSKPVVHCLFPLSLSPR